jgi:hypothetical protein
MFGSKRRTEFRGVYPTMRIYAVGESWSGEESGGGSIGPLEMRSRRRCFSPQRYHGDLLSLESRGFDSCLASFPGGDSNTCTVPALRSFMSCSGRHRGIMGLNGHGRRGAHDRGLAVQRVFQGDLRAESPHREWIGTLGFLVV